MSGQGGSGEGDDRGTRVEEVHFNDAIHGHMRLHRLLVAIINTPQFHRLRDIKQLGGAYYVYPAASHNRFEHCIGVAYLAGELVETLRRQTEKQPKLYFSEKQALCVKVAGLCHDLGHGPFSHAFDGMFLPKAMEDDDEYKKDKSKYEHEYFSGLLFDKLYDENRKIFEKERLYKDDCEFIKELINPPERGKEVCLKGKKSFLYEIVSNKANGIDVDKWDYFLRDCHGLGLTCGFQLRRLMDNIKVLETDDNLYHLCFAIKTRDNIMEMFYTRNFLHRKAYQHKKCKAVELMIRDALLESEYHRERLCDAVKNMESDPQDYQKITDSFVNDSGLDLIVRIQKGELYKTVADEKVPNKPNKRSADFERLNEERETAIKRKKQEYPESSGFTYHEAVFDFGNKDSNPLARVQFYEKDEKMAEQDEDYQLYPRHWMETRLRVYKK